MLIKYGHFIVGYPHTKDAAVTAQRDLLHKLRAVMKVGALRKTVCNLIIK